MFDIDLIAQYFPAASEVPEVDVQIARVRAEAFLRERFPDEDMAPGSVFGDRFVSAMAYGIAAAGVALGRVLSDLDLDNVARNVIYNCDFVRAYMGNHGVYDTTEMESTGVLRLTFTDDLPRTVGKNLQFEAGGAVYEPRETIEVVTSTTVPGEGQLALVRAQDTLWEVDIAVSAPASVAAPLVGTTFRVSTLLPGLVGAAAAADFHAGIATRSLAEIARRTRLTSLSPTPHNRGGTRAAVMANWPDTSFVFPAITGDVELQRASPLAGPLALPVGCMDIYLASRNGWTTRTLQVRLNYDEARKVFRGATDLGRPRRVREVRQQNAVQNFQVFARAQTPAEGLAFTNSSNEALWVEVEPETDADGFPLITRLSDSDSTYAMFDIEVDYDPSFVAVAERLTSADFAPVGIDVVVRHPFTASVSISVVYRRTPGMRFLAAAARERIARYVAQLNYPDVFSTADVARIVRVAGAHSVERVDVTGRTFVSPATRKFQDAANVAAPGADWEEISDVIPDVTVSSADDLLETHELTSLGLLCVSSRNTQVVLESINLIEA